MRTIQRLLRADGPDALVISHMPHVRYLTGFTGSNGWLLLRPGSALFMTDPRYREQASQEVRGMRTQVIFGRTFSTALQEMRLHEKIGTLGFEADHLSATIAANLKKLLRPLRVLPLSGLVEELRSVKLEDELHAIRKAIAISEAVYEDVVPLLRPGVTEIDIAAELTYRQRRLGADGDAFPPIVLFGKRSSLVHGQPTRAKLTRRSPVLIDFGCRVNGYGSDLTRTLHFGPAPRAFRSAYETVLAAQQAGCDAVQAGVPAAEIDALVRSHIAEAGLGDYFEHGLGHGIGLEMHETPLLSWRNTAPLEAGEVITIEPGVYLPGAFGIRIEDDLLVTLDGSITLSSLPRALRELA
ncbi:MAG: aminopeptidase P family protein [Bacteroidetes bacterium]|nr:aminopeptidase P family protein [Bacteroidota bacterium]